jgi:hypothetical protein
MRVAQLFGHPYVLRPVRQSPERNAQNDETPEDAD